MEGEPLILSTDAYNQLRQVSNDCKLFHFLAVHCDAVQCEEQFGSDGCLRSDSHSKHIGFEVLHFDRISKGLGYERGVCMVTSEV